MVVFYVHMYISACIYRQQMILVQIEQRVSHKKLHGTSALSHHIVNESMKLNGRMCFVSYSIRMSSMYSIYSVPFGWLKNLNHHTVLSVWQQTTLTTFSTPASVACVVCCFVFLFAKSVVVQRRIMAARFKSN